MGLFVGEIDGISIGADDGLYDGLSDGLNDGAGSVGFEVGWIVGENVLLSQAKYWVAEQKLSSHNPVEPRPLVAIQSWFWKLFGSFGPQFSYTKSILMHFFIYKKNKVRTAFGSFFKKKKEKMDKNQ